MSRATRRLVRGTAIVVLATVVAAIDPRLSALDRQRFEQRPGSGPAAAAPAAFIFPLTIASSVVLDAPPAAPAGFDAANAYVPLRTGQLEAVSLAATRKIWEAAVATSAQPACGDGLVFVSAGEAIQALRPSDGSVTWSVSAGTPAPGGGPYWWTGRVLTSNARGDLVLMQAADGRKVWQQALEDGRVMALRIATGERVWQRKLGGPPSAPAVDGDRVYVGSLDNAFYALSAADGRVKWRWATGGDIVGRPVVSRDRVYVLSLDNLLRALDKGGGAQRWKTPLPTRPSSGPLALGDVFLMTGVAPTLYAFRVTDGAPAGSYAVAVDGDLVGSPFVQAGLMAVDATFFIVTGDGQLIALRSGRTAVPPMTLTAAPPSPGQAPPGAGRVRP